MGLMANTVSICQLQVTGELPTKELGSWAGEQLGKFAFQNIDDSAQELSVGWVNIDDARGTEFAAPGAYWRDRYLVFTLRKDQRKLPAAIFKARLQLAERDFLATMPGLARVPKQKREELKEQVKARLLARILPSPSLCDAVWDTATGVITVASLATATLDLFDSLFKKTFPGLRLVARHPYARAQAVVPKRLAAALEKANRANNEAVLSLIHDNRWLGEDLLLWLLYQTRESSSEYRITQPGEIAEATPFLCYINDRVVLQQTGNGGVQRVTVAGPQDHYDEVRAALTGGKKITEACVCFEREEWSWRLTLKGELFQFASFKCPAVRLEGEATGDLLLEQEAVFYERMKLMGEGLQMFDSVLERFLDVRLGADWDQVQAAICAWQQGT